MNLKFRRKFQMALRGFCIWTLHIQFICLWIFNSGHSWQLQCMGKAFSVSVFSWWNNAIGLFANV